MPPGKQMENINFNKSMRESTWLGPTKMCAVFCMLSNRKIWHRCRQTQTRDRLKQIHDSSCSPIRSSECEPTETHSRLWCWSWWLPLRRLWKGVHSASYFGQHWVSRRLRVSTTAANERMILAFGAVHACLNGDCLRKISRSLCLCCESQDA